MEKRRETPHVLLSVYKHAKTTQRKNIPQELNVKRKLETLEFYNVLLAVRRSFNRVFKKLLAEITNLYWVKVRLG